MVTNSNKLLWILVGACAIVCAAAVLTALGLSSTKSILAVALITAIACAIAALLRQNLDSGTNVAGTGQSKAAMRETERKP